MLEEPHEIKGIIYIGSEMIEFGVARVGDGWIEATMEATYLVPELAKMKSQTGNFDQHYEKLTHTLAQIRDQIFGLYGMIPVQVLAGVIVRNYERRNELNWLIEEATGYRLVVLNEKEEKKYSLTAALLGNVLDESGFDSVVEKLKKASETDAF